MFTANDARALMTKNQEEELNRVYRVIQTCAKQSSNNDIAKIGSELSDETISTLRKGGFVVTRESSFGDAMTGTVHYIITWRE